jgi:hypothetical protein
MSVLDRVVDRLLGRRVEAIVQRVLDQRRDDDLYRYRVHGDRSRLNIDKFDRERQTAIPRTGRDVVIHEGAWLASGVLVLGPCEIGAHAVVGAGSLVLGDVPPYAIVVGRPAKLVRMIEPPPRGEGDR